MWDAFEIAEGLERVREYATVVQLLCMLGIVVTIVVCGYMAFGHGHYVWLRAGWP